MVPSQVKPAVGRHHCWTHVEREAERERVWPLWYSIVVAWGCTEAFLPDSPAIQRGCATNFVACYLGEREQESKRAREPRCRVLAKRAKAWSRSRISKGLLGMCATGDRPNPVSCWCQENIRLYSEWSKESASLWLCGCGEWRATGDITSFVNCGAFV